MLSYPLSSRDNSLFIEGVSTDELVDEFDTPLYVMSENRVKYNYNRLKSAFDSYEEGFRIFYSAKANTNLEILKILKDEGACIDAVSPGEVYLAKKAGFTSDKVLFTGTSVRDDGIDYILKEGVSSTLTRSPSLEGY